MAPTDPGGHAVATPTGPVLFAYDGTELAAVASLAIESAPIWKGIIETAQDHHVSLIVLGSHRRSGLTGHLLGSVAAAVAAHSRFPVLIVPQAS
jgi:nucleotide-binding universal stress UspA family protein